MKATPTSLLRRGVEGECRACGQLPLEFIDGLRDCLEAGMSAELVLASLKLIAGLCAAVRTHRQSDVVARAEYMVQVMVGDIEIEAKEKEFRQRLSEKRQKRL